MDERLDVYLGERLAGGLVADDEGRMTFLYAEGRASPSLSLSLPTRREPYPDAECRPFFAGLLPEGAALQKAADSRRLQVYDTFKLLAEFGGDCAGAVRLLRPRAQPAIQRKYEPLDGEKLAQEVADIVKAPNFARDERVRLSVAGAQNKTAVRVDGKGRIYKPLEGSPSTHLLKVGSERFPTAAERGVLPRPRSPARDRRRRGRPPPGRRAILPAGPPL